MAQVVKNPPANAGAARQRGLDPWVRSLGQKGSLEMEMATHSSILAWKIPRIE